MTNRLGEAIQLLAKILLAISLIISVIGAAVSFGNENLAGGFILLLAGPLSSFLSFILIYGFGKLLENSDTQISYLQMILHQTAPVSVPKQERATDSVSAQTQSVFNNSVLPVRPIIDDEGQMICPICATKQRSDRQKCFKCGQIFINDQTDIS